MTANATNTLPDIRLAEIIEHVVALEDVDCISWAMLESYPGFDFGFDMTSEGYKVEAEFGEFQTSLALLYHTVQGQEGVIVDDVVIAVVGKSFWKETCRASTGSGT